MRALACGRRPRVTDEECADEYSSKPHDGRCGERPGVGVAANVQAAVCGVQVGAQVLTILSALGQGQEVECTNDAGNQTVTIDQVGG